MSLRDYQVAAIESCRFGLRSGKQRQCLTVPTGGGKTRIATGIIESANSKGKTVLFVCNRIELVLQARDAFARHGLEVGVIQGDNSDYRGQKCIAASIQTIARRGIPDADLIIIDECHGVPGSKAFLDMMISRNAVPLIGLTATPFAKGMGRVVKELHGPLFDSLIVGATIPDLIGQGFLVDCDIYAPSEPDLSNVKIVAGDYQEDQLEEAVNKPKLIGDIVEHYRKLANGKKTIVFATSIYHSKAIVQEFNGYGYRAKHLDAYTDSTERREIIEGFKRGDFEILSNCSLLSEGFDCPETECIILARPTRSLIRYIQMAGRALRPFHGKDKALILDHSGTVRRLGFPTEEIPMFLDDGKKREQGEPKDLPIICKSCFAVKPKKTRKCPVCGFEPEITQEEIQNEAGELVKAQRKEASKMSQDEKQEIYSALVGFAMEKGIRVGWAYHKFFEMLGVHPSNALAKEPGPMCKRVEDWLLHERIKKAKGYVNGRNIHQCPKCKQISQYVKTPPKGPHGYGARCNCGAFWWLPKEAA